MEVNTKTPYTVTSFKTNTAIDLEEYKNGNVKESYMTANGVKNGKFVAFHTGNIKILFGIIHWDFLAFGHPDSKVF